MKPIVIFVAQDTQLDQGIARHMGKLAARGLAVQSCAGGVALQDALQAIYSERDDALVLVVLDNGPQENGADTQLITVMFPQCRVVSVLASPTDEAQVAALQSGADACLDQQASAGLLQAMLFGLMRRAGLMAATLDSGFSPHGEWALVQQGWVLVGPEGCEYTLTTSERGFLTELMSQPDLRASHQQLIRAADLEREDNSKQLAQGRLGVLVSRLRRKLRAKCQCDLPVKSLHKWGYMFTGDIRH